MRKQACAKGKYPSILLPEYASENQTDLGCLRDRQISAMSMVWLKNTLLIYNSMLQYTM